ncbi:MAG: succinate dehydrogenase assembly factor 2 [Pseudomonadota bacterium]
MTDPASQLPRLRWRCRRGMRELDVLMTNWLEKAYLEASPELQAAFESLLDQEDDAIWDWMMGRATPPDSLAAVVASICERHAGPQQ